MEYRSVTRWEAIQEFGQDSVEGAEMVTLMRNDYYFTGVYTASINVNGTKKMWRFEPTQKQLDTLELILL